MRVQVYFGWFTGTRPQWTAQLLLLVFSFLFLLGLVLFLFFSWRHLFWVSLLQLGCFALISTLNWALRTFTDSASRGKSTSLDISFGCFSFGVWLLKFCQIFLYFFPGHFLFGLAGCAGCAASLKLNIVYRDLLIYPRLLEFCRLFLFSTGYFSFTGSTPRTYPGNLRRSFLFFSRSFLFGIRFLFRL